MRRLSLNERYPNVLEKELNKNIDNNDNNEYKINIISEGLNGRTISENDYEGNEKKYSS